MFTYGQVCLKGRGELILIYPKQLNFQEPSSSYDFSNEMKLWVVPFDLGSEKLLFSMRGISNGAIR